MRLGIQNNDINKVESENTIAMGRIKKAIDRLKQPRSVSAEQQENRHLKNIGGGNIITINGKEYVKVKLRFVDTLNANGSQYLMNLEAELELLRKEVEELRVIRDANAAKIESLENFTVNLYKEIDIEKIQHRNHELKLQNELVKMYRDKTNQYKKRLEDKNATIAAFEKELQLHKKQSIKQRKENEKLQKEIQQQNIDMLEVMAQIERLQATDKATL